MFQALRSFWAGCLFIIILSPLLMAQQQGDVGLTLEPETCSGFPVITGFVSRSPAAMSSIAIDDLLVEIDDESTAKQRISEIQKKLRGEPGTLVRLGLKSGKKAYIVTLVRQDLSKPDAPVKPIITVNGKPYNPERITNKVASVAGVRGPMPSMPTHKALEDVSMACISLQTIFAEVGVDYKHLKKGEIESGRKWKSSVRILPEKEAFILLNEKGIIQWETILFETQNKQEAEAAFSAYQADFESCNKEYVGNLFSFLTGKDYVWQISQTDAQAAARMILKLYKQEENWMVKVMIVR